MPTKQEIKDYYNFSKLDYQLYNRSLTNLSLHYGLWDKTTRNHKEALLNENRVLAELAHITPTDNVIDLGCGYGATAVWLASNIGCHVTGITLSDVQQREATKFAKNRDVSHLVNFSVMDYHHANFSDNSFDVAIGIESICYSTEKIQVLKEAYRILKPGGRIVVADGYLTKDLDKYNPHDREIIRICFEGIHIPPLSKKEEFEQWLKDTGFLNVQWQDKIKSIMPTAKIGYRLGKTFLPVSKLFGLFGVKSLRTAEMEAFINQYYAMRDGLGVYGIFYGEK